ncbi:MAG: hypothetical protein JW725_01140 [Candidatus Babeliaceae bacterium]|nr:hypothetical protein [Candidatus Babeliaceae bacterium]
MHFLKKISLLFVSLASSLSAMDIEHSIMNIMKNNKQLETLTFSPTFSMKRGEIESIFRLLTGQKRTFFLSDPTITTLILNREPTSFLCSAEILLPTFNNITVLVFNPEQDDARLIRTLQEFMPEKKDLSRIIYLKMLLHEFGHLASGHTLRRNNNLGKIDLDQDITEERMADMYSIYMVAAYSGLRELMNIGSLDDFFEAAFFLFAISDFEMEETLTHYIAKGIETGDIITKDGNLNVDYLSKLNIELTEDAKPSNEIDKNIKQAVKRFQLLKKNNLYNRTAEDKEFILWVEKIGIPTHPSLIERFSMVSWFKQALQKEIAGQKPWPTFMEVFEKYLSYLDKNTDIEGQIDELNKYKCVIINKQKNKNQY